MFHRSTSDVHMRMRDQGRREGDRARRRRLRLRPRMEHLEDRVVLSTVTWNSAVSPSGGDWDTAANWVGGVIPGSGDDVIIKLTNPGTVTLNTGANDSVNSLVADANTTIAIASDTLSLAATSSIGGGLTLSGGTLTGGGTLTVAGPMAWTGGTMSGSGRTVAKGGLSLGGTSSGYYDEYLYGRELDNYGAATLDKADGYGGGLHFRDGATFANEAGATLSLGTDVPILDDGGTPDGGTLVNAGTLSKDGGTGTSSINVAVTNSGTIEAASGTLSLQGMTSVTGTGVVSASGSGVLSFDNGTASLSGGATISGTGTVAIKSGTVSIDGAVSDSAATTAMSNGTLTGGGTVTVTRSLVWTGGAMTGSGKTVTKGGLSLGGTSSGYYDEYLYGRELDNYGTATLDKADGYGGGLHFRDGATFDNEAGATLSLGTDVPIVDDGGTPAGGTVVNAGTLAKTGGTGTSSINVALTNSGTIQAASGTLSLQGATSVSATGVVSATGPGTLAFNGEADLAGGATISGTGTVAIKSGTISIDGAVSDSAATTAMSNGTLTGGGTLTVTGSLAWTGGTMTGAGKTVTKGGLTLGGTSSGYYDEYLYGRELDNYRAATLDKADGYGGGLHFRDGATFANEAGATLSLGTDVPILDDGGTPAGGTLVNAGTLAKTGGTGTSSINVALTNSGTIQAASGTLSLQGMTSVTGTGVVSASGSGVLSFDNGTASLSGGAKISGTGTVAIKSGTVSIDGAVSDSAATTAMSGGTLTGAGTLTVTGSLVWTGGTMTGSGKTVTKGGLSLGGTSSGYYDEYLYGRELDNYGSATLDKADGYGGGLHFRDGATFANEAGATLSLGTDVPILDDGGTPAGGTVVNAGTLAKTGGTGTSTINVALSNSGTIQAASGTLCLQGAFSNFSAATQTLTGGSYVVSATLQFNGADIATNAASISLIGAAAGIIDGSGNDALRDFATNAAGASFSIQDGRNVTTPGGFSNAGSVTVGKDSSFTATGDYTQSGGSTNLVNGGTLASTTNVVTINGGSLGGVGTVRGNVTSAGQVVPGGAGGVGILNVAGSFTQTSKGSTTIDLGGPNPGTGYSQLLVSGKATLDGTLDVYLVNGFAPGDGATFSVLGYNPHSGQFATIVPHGFPAGTSLGATYTATALVLKASVAPVLTSITVTPANPSLAKGLTESFTAVGTYSDKSTADLTNLVTWASSNAATATVSNASPSQGVASALAVGTTTITATLDGLTGSTSLTVTPAALASIAVTPANPSVAKGLTASFTATGTYTDKTTADLTSKVTWASANTAIATISASGVATGTGIGSTQIGATLGGIAGSTTLKVTAALLTSIAVTPADSSVAKGLSRQLTATGTYTDNSTADITGSVTWTTADASTATVSGSGLTTGVAVGTTTITATLSSVSGTTGIHVTPAIVQSIAVTPSNPSVAKGLTEQFTATGTYSDSSTADLTSQVTWASSDQTVATIDAAGLATGIGKGSASITATLGTVVDSTTLTVTAGVLTSIAVTPASPSVAKGLTEQFTATGTYSDKTTADLTSQVTWATVDAGVATIDGVGRATGVGLGTTKVTAMLGAIAGTASITVTAAVLQGIAVSPASASVAKGLTEQFTATGTYSDKSTADLTSQVTWASSDQTVATIDATGLATGIGKGAATITATLGSITGSSSITVTAGVLMSIAVTPSNPSVAKGLTQQFTATGTYSDKSTADLTSQVTWASSDSTISTIGAGGLAATLAQGTSTITAAMGSVIGSTTLSVTPAALALIALSPANPSVALGQSEAFTATGTYTDGSTKDLTTTATWSSKDTSVATISNASGSQGLAMSLAKGSTLISATVGGVIGTTTLTVGAAVLASITVAPAGPSVPVGRSEVFTAMGAYTDGTKADVTDLVTWSSATTSVGTISNAPGSQGVAKALAVGTTKIAATLGGVVGTTTMTVTPAVLTSISVSPAGVSVAKGLTGAFTATGTYSDQSTVDLTTQVAWASSDKSVATIDATGLATGIGKGTATITATLGSIAGSASITVTAAVLESIAVSPSTPTVVQGKSVSFAATGTYSDNSTADLTSQVTWASGNAAVASIDAHGVATALSPGTAGITASLAGVSGVATLTVTPKVQATVGAVAVMWGTTGRSSVQTASDGLRLLPEGRVTDLPWYGINAISITLSQTATLSSGDVSIRGLNGTVYGPVKVSGSGADYVLTLAAPIDAADRVTITIGNADVATFTRRLDVLPGDVNDDGSVTMQDAVIERNGYLNFAPVPIALTFLDILGTGSPSLANYNQIRKFIGTRLP